MTYAGPGSRSGELLAAGSANPNTTPAWLPGLRLPSGAGAGVGSHRSSGWFNGDIDIHVVKPELLPADGASAPPYD